MLSDTLQQAIKQKGERVSDFSNAQYGVRRSCQAYHKAATDFGMETRLTRSLG